MKLRGQCEREREESWDGACSHSQSDSHSYSRSHSHAHAHAHPRGHSQRTVKAPAVAREAGRTWLTWLTWYKVGDGPIVEAIMPW